MSNPARNCPACHQPLPADAPQGLCPQCLAKSALGSQPGGEETIASGSKPGGSGPATIQPEIARLFPQLEILAPLGQGGMGMVYKARQPQLDRIVALKVMRADLSRDPAFAERFAREARALAKLNHPNIVSVFDFGRSGGHCWILMEFVDGTNLRELLRTKTLQPREALGIVPKVCDALQYAHDEGIVHRDIKPENILLDKKGRVKIADFGLAKLVGKDASEFSLTATGMTLGTPRYMAPEQFDKPQEVDHRADIYSLGVVLYEMLTGEVPMGRFSLPSATIGVDVRLDEIVLRTLEKEPSRRYQHASEVKTQVENVTGIHAAPTLAEAAAASQQAISQSSTEPRLSRLAMWGAICATIGFLSCLTVFVLVSNIAYYLGLVAVGEKSIPDRFWAVIVPLLPLCIILPVAATVLGWQAIREIRTSAGSLNGLGMALFAGLIFPLLLLDAMVVGFCSSLSDFIGGMFHWDYRSKEGLWGSLSLLTCVVVDYCLVVRAWRSASGSASNAGQPAGSAQTLTSEKVRAKLRLAGIGLLIVGIINAFAGLIWIGSNVSALTGLWQNDSPWGWQFAQTLISLGSIVIVYYQVGVGIWLMNPDDDGDPTFVLVMSALCPPGCVLGLPVAIYAFMQLTKPEGKARLAALRAQPAPVTTATEPGKPLDHRVSEALAVGLPGWFNRRAPWMQKLIQAALTFAVACATLVFLGFNIHSKTDVTSGLVTNSGAIQIGQPSPWLTVDFSSTNHSFGIHWFSASLWIGLVGLALGCLSERLRRSAPGFDEVADRRKRRIWLVVMIVVLVFYAIALVVNGLTMSGATGKSALGVMQRALGLAPSTALEIARDNSKLPTTQTPGRRDFAFTFTAPSNHVLHAWLEFWKDGKLEIPTSLSESYLPARGDSIRAGLHLTTQDGDMAGVGSAGQMRFDWALNRQARVVTDISKLSSSGTSHTGQWRTNVLKELSARGSSSSRLSWDNQPAATVWRPKPGEVTTVLAWTAHAGKSVSSSDLDWTEEGLPKGSPAVAILLRVRFDPVAPGELSVAPMTKFAAINAKNRGPLAAGGVTYLDGHTSIVKAIAVSPDGRTLVSAGMDGRVIIRDLPDGKVRRIAIASSHPKSAPLARFRSGIITADGQRAIVGGDIRELQSIPLFIPESETLHIDLLRVPNENGASIDKLMSAGGSKLAYITGRDEELVFYDTGAARTLAKVPLNPGQKSHVMRAVASPDGQFFAVTTARLAPKTSDPSISETVAPFKLAVFDTTGAERLAWLFADSADFLYAQLVFADARTLALCLPSGKLQRWTLDGAGTWQPAAESARIVPGRYTASAASRDGKIIWLAESNQITGIDSMTGQGRAFIELKIGERRENYTGSAIDQIAVTGDRLTIVAALWDGRVALARCHRLD